MTATNQGSKIGGLKQISGETPVFHPFFPFLGNRFSTKNRGRPWTFPKLWPPPDDWKALEKRHQKSKSTTKVTWRRLIVSLYFCSFSRMRSEGFPFIVGVWGWTCVRFVLLPRRRLVVVSSSPRRRVVVASSSRRRRQLVANSLIHCHWAVHSHCDTILSFKVWKVEEVSHSFWRSQVTKCEVIFVFCVTGAILWQCVNASVTFFRGRRSTLWCDLFAMSWQAQHFVTWRRCCFHESQWQWRANVTLLQISWQAQDLVIVLKSGGSFAKVILFELCKNGFIRKTRTKSSIFELKVWNLKEKYRTKCSFWRFKLSRWEVIFVFCVAGARLWKLLDWKVEEASYEMLVLEACSLKSCGSLPRNARFGSLSLEKLRKSRTKCSFWKLVAWKVAEASHEMLVLEACSLKSWGSLARNACFESLFLEKLRKPRTKCSFWKLLYYFVVRSSTGVVLCSTE